MLLHLLLLLGRERLVRIALAGELAQLVGDQIVVGQVREVHGQRHDAQRHVGRQTSGELIHGLEHHLAQRARVVLLADDEISQRSGDVVDVAHRAIRLHLGLVDLHPLQRAFVARQADHLLFRVPLLNEAEQLLALRLNCEA